MMARTCFLVGVLHAASAATVGPHLFKDAEGPKVLRGLFPSEAAPEKIIEPFVGESYPLVRVHRDGDKKSGDDATAEALVSELKDKLPGMSTAEAIDLLASNGNLIKRPFLIDGDRGLVGFKEPEWTDFFG